ncbi:unnamed protein product [Paramecium pentaurelia]|uniref:Uncharacterized protein n=1 Tax=Paramecium pentaurelia TaxID=43138 RepID=A0A8S1XKK5_9CILI|nr:unnamed protein product [Paramecium pentaurelia]CAD8201971.1 unnamed protein product [Paramecium pentaurelia]
MVQQQIKKQSVINVFFANFINTLNFYKKKYLFFFGLDTLIKKQSSNLLSNPKYINDQKFKYQLKVIHPLKKIGLNLFFILIIQIKGKNHFHKKISEHDKYQERLNHFYYGTKFLIRGGGFKVRLDSQIKIQVETHGHRMCFINSYFFTFQSQGESKLNYYIIQMNHFQIKEYQIKIYLKDCAYFSLICITVKRKYYLINAKTLQIIYHIRELYRDDQPKNYEQPISHLFKRNQEYKEK